MLRLTLLAWILAPFASAMNVLVFIPGTLEWEKKPFMRIAQDLTFRFNSTSISLLIWLRKKNGCGDRNHDTATFKGIIIPEQRYLVKQVVSFCCHA